MGVLKVGPNNRTSLIEIAASLRRRAEQTLPPFSTAQIIDACFPGAVVTGRRLPLDTDEVVRVDEHAWRTHRAPHVIVYNRARSTAEQRYAIAHALGHVIFDGPRHGCRDDADRELRCDRFADELLVPLAELEQYVCMRPSTIPAEQETFLDMVDQIASQFHVPVAVILRRIDELSDASL